MEDEFYAYIIDWVLPDLSGVEVVKQLRAAIGDETPIIILSAYDWRDIEEEFKGSRFLLVEDNVLNREIAEELLRESGMNAHVAKPIDLPVLMEAIYAELRKTDKSRI